MVSQAPITPANGSAQFRKKPPELQRLINEALHVLERFGVPIADLTARRRERMALSFLAVADVKRSEEWKKAKDITGGRSLKTRDIIQYINEHFHEEISSGSYDDIRRQDLLLPVSAEIIIPTSPKADPNNPQRGYALSEAHGPLVRVFGGSDWEQKVEKFMAGQASLAVKLAAPRTIERIPIILGGGEQLNFGAGEHNRLIKAAIEEFLPRFGYGAEVLYVGDADRRLLYVKAERLTELKLPEPGRQKLPDIIAYSADKQWVYVIEAVHSAGAISPTRHLVLEELARECVAGIVFVTAFADKNTFRRFAADIAWETEVWIAEAPDHLVHFDGEQFLGPYSSLNKETNASKS